MSKYTKRERTFLKFFTIAYYINKSATKAIKISCDLSGTSEKLGELYLNKFRANGHAWRDLIENGDLGHLYLIKAGETDSYKIGITKNSLDGRLKMLQIGNPFVLELKRDTHTYFYKQLEKVLHFILSDLNIRSEWFELDPATFKILDSRLCLLNTLYK